MVDFHQIPASVTTHILHFVSSIDILQLRATSKHFHSLLTNSDESEVIWRNALVRDFQLQNIKDASALGSCMLQCPRIRPRRIERNHDTTAISIFGYHLSDSGAFFKAESAFEAWRHWCKASRIFFSIGSEDCSYSAQDCTKNNGCQILEHDGVSTQISRKEEHEHYFVNAPYFLRAWKLWQKILHWCLSDDSGSYGRRLLASLEDGVTRSNGRFVDCKDRDVVHSLEAVFAFVGGQVTLSDIDDSTRRRREALVGLFGGYAVYDHVQCTRLCSSKDALLVDRPSGYAILGFNFLTRSYRAIGVNLMNGKIDLITRNGFQLAFENTQGQKDAGLEWMEEYARRLSEKELCVRKEKLFDGSPYEWLSPFPSKTSPMCSCKVTRGIEVVASSTTAAEIDVVAYSIRIRQLERGEPGYMEPEERGFHTCQLLSRHWILTDFRNNHVDEVNGEGVVGRFPLLFEGGYRDDFMTSVTRTMEGEEEAGTFVYQSCATIKSGTFEGRIMFVPGSIARPTGEPFFVHVGKFSLEAMGDFIY
jgi:uncharacterized protein affecting Mg2+/Co2+ transport